MESELRELVDGEVRFDAGTRAAYSTDASNFRQVPIGVVVPRTIEAAAEAVAVCHRARPPGRLPRRRHQPGRPVHQHGRGDRLFHVTATGWSRSTPTRGPVWSSRASCSTSSTGSSPPHGLRFGPEPATHHQLHPGRDDRQQLLRSHRPAHRQGRRQHRLAGRRSSTTAPGSPVGPTRRRGPTREIAAAPATAAPRCTRSAAPVLRDAVPRRPDPRRGYPRDPAPGLGLQPRLAAARARASTSPGAGGSESHPGHRPACRARAGAGGPGPHPGRARLPRHRRRRRRGARRPRARTDRPGGRRPLPGPRRAAQGHEPRGPRGAARGAPGS